MSAVHTGASEEWVDSYRVVVDTPHLIAARLTRGHSRKEDAAAALPLLKERYPHAYLVHYSFDPSLNLRDWDAQFDEVDPADTVPHHR